MRFRRFVDDALGFALTWNYWFNDAVSTASDIIALQLLLQFWTDNFPGWAISLIFLIIVIGLNLLSVRVYGEVCVFNISSIGDVLALRLLLITEQVEYWLSLLKVITIVVCLAPSMPIGPGIQLTDLDIYYSGNCCQLRW